jgi:hypothetical protein
MVLLEPLPPRVIPEVGSSVVLDEAAVTASWSLAVAESETVNPINEEEVLARSVWLAMAEIVGGVFSSGGGSAADTDTVLAAEMRLLPNLG